MLHRRRSPNPPRRAVALVVVAVLLAGCAGGAAAPSSVAGTPAAPTPALTPVGGGPATPQAGSGEPPTEAEQGLLAGLRLDLVGTCAPAREALPPGGVAMVACLPDSDVARLVTVAAFDDTGSLLAAYGARVEAEGIGLRSGSGSCLDGGPSEGAYTPGDDLGGPLQPGRSACWVGGAGEAHFLATRSPYVLIEAEGAEGVAIPAVERYAWLGNQDMPGAPTLWAETPVSPEK